jgi:hypothetical protein
MAGEADERYGKVFCEGKSAIASLKNGKNSYIPICVNDLNKTY